VLTREKQVADIGAVARAPVYGNPLIDMIHVRGGSIRIRFVNALADVFVREFGNLARLPQRAILFEVAR
jgi:hypothetical protein